jgi:hypothetical protein
MMKALELEETLAFYGQPPQPKIPIKYEPIPLGNLKIAPKGSMYLIQLDVSPLTQDKAVEALNRLTAEMKTKFGIQTLYGKAAKDKIYLLIKGSPFSWLALLAWLPVILGLLGIVLFGVSVWQAIAAIPSWVWACLVIGGALIILGPAIGNWILSEVEKRTAK